jgi:hypothetical protein
MEELAGIEEIKKSKLIEELPAYLSSEKPEVKKEERKESPLSPASPGSKREVKRDCLMIKLSQHRCDENGIPIHLLTLVNTMRENPKMMELEGIFRKSGSIEEEQEIISDIGKMSKAGLLEPT